MSNFILAYGNRADLATLSGGSWVAGLPANNLKDRRLGLVARSTNAVLTSTKFDADIGADKLVRVVALGNHNFSLDALYRIRGFSDAGYSINVYDSGWKEVWPAVYGLTRDWQAPNFWSGKYLADEMTGFTWTLIQCLPAAINTRYWRIEIDDTTNAAGYVQAGRLFIGDAWQPLVNMSYGVGLGWESPTEVQQAISGAEYFDERTPYRVVKFETAVMTEADAFDNASEIMRRMGLSGEVLFVWDPDDTTQALRRSFLGRLRQLSPIEYPYSGLDRTKTGWEIKELQ